MRASCWCRCSSALSFKGLFSSGRKVALIRSFFMAVRKEAIDKTSSSSDSFLPEGNILRSGLFG